MARRRKKNAPSAGVLLLVVFLLVVLALAESHPTAFALALLAIVGFFVHRYWRRRQSRRRMNQEIDERLNSQLAWLRMTNFPSGHCSVLLTAVRADYLKTALQALGENQGVDEVGDWQSVMRRVEHIGPQTLVAGVQEDTAIQLKELLEDWGARIKIREGVAPVAGNGLRRQPISEHVRGEVWRRDGGQCVDCGSRERLEFDHIVPVSKGGSNTARNLELRCEPCNRKKAARI